jgi:hypothetical protein
MSIMKFSWAISRVRWFSFVDTNVSTHQFNNPEDEDGDGLRNFGLYKTELPYPADSPRKLHYAKYKLASSTTHAYILVRKRPLFLPKIKNTNSDQILSSQLH